MKQKKTVASVVLGVALVSLITAIVAGLAEGIMELTDMPMINSNKDYYYVAGGLTLGGALFATAFVVPFFVNKKHRFAVNCGLAVAVIVYCIVAIIVMRCTVPSQYRSYRPTSEGYLIFTSYLTTAITVMVCTALVFAAWACLTRWNKNAVAAIQTPPAEAPLPETDENKQ